MCDATCSESGQLLTIKPCGWYLALASDRDRLAGVVVGMELQNARNLDAMRRAEVEVVRHKSIIASLNDQLVKARTCFSKSALEESGLRRENARLREALKAVEWVGDKTDDGWPTCPYCDADEGLQHKDDCLIGNALKEVG